MRIVGAITTRRTRARTRGERWQTLMRRGFDVSGPASTITTDHATITTEHTTHAEDDTRRHARPAWPHIAAQARLCGLCDRGGCRSCRGATARV